MINQIEEANNQLNRGLYLESINTLTNYIDKYPDNREGYLNRAKVYSIIGMTSESNKDLKRAYILDPLHLLYQHNNVVTQNTPQKKYSYDWINEDPLSIYKSPINENEYLEYIKSMDMGDIQDSLIIRSIQALANNDLSSAVYYIQRVDPYLSNTALIFDIKGLVSLKQGHVKEALDLFNLATIHMPDFALAYHNQSICYELLGRAEESKASLLKAINLNAQVATYYFTKALRHEKSGETLNAEKYYLTALELNEAHLEATSNYALLMRTLGHYEKAIDLIDRSIDLNPQKMENYFMRGGINLSFGNYKSAIEDLEIYVDDSSDDSETLYNLGLAYLLHGDAVKGCLNISDAGRRGFDIKHASMITYSCQNL